MTDPKDSGGPKDKPGAASADPKRSSATVGGDAAGTDKRSGRVSYDARGNPTWEWQLETGVYSRDLSTQRLKKLDLGDLSIAESAIQQRPAGLGANKAGMPKKPPLPGGGFNPYDSSSAGGGSNPYDNANKPGAAPQPQKPKAASPPPRKPAPAAPAPKPSAWSKLRQLVSKDKDSDDGYE